jgi:hypothetical protein
MAQIDGVVRGTVFISSLYNAYLAGVYGIYVCLGVFCGFGVLAIGLGFMKSSAPKNKVSQTAPKKKITANIASSNRNICPHCSKSFS